jgi:hypothetical protein
MMEPAPFDIDRYVTRSRAVDLSGIAWDEIRNYPLPADAVRTLRYMQDIECHTIIYLRELLATRVIDDPEVAAFLPCWFYEEAFHGRALARFLEAAGHSTIERVRSREGFRKRLEASAIAGIGRMWRDFTAAHMSWGAINELTTLTGYKRLTEVAQHPVLDELLKRIIRDESRHFDFYFRQAERRLKNPGAARVTRFLIEHFWAPVGSGVQPVEEVRFLARYLLSGPEGRDAARRIDSTIGTLPGLAGVRLVESWVDRECGRGDSDRLAAAGGVPVGDIAECAPNS